MADRLVLYIGEKNVSSWSMRPYVALLEKGIRFEEREISLQEDRDRSRRREIGPTGRVPVLHHMRDQEPPLVIPDSLAIIEYLEETFSPPEYPALWPADRRTRARARWMAAAMHSGFAKLRESMSFNLCFQPERPKASAEALADARELLGMWERALSESSGPFLCGAFGAVDAMFAPAVWRLAAFGVPVKETPKAGAYIESVLARPSVKTWLDAGKALPPVTEY